MSACTVPPRPAARRGWCPGIARPMATGDGLLVRIHPRHGCLSATQLESLADLAERFGNGLADVTSRGNLQLRGVAERDHASLIESLSRIGFVDHLPATGPQRVVFVDPLSGLDGRPDLRPLADHLEAALQELRPDLPGKFCIALRNVGAPPALAADLDVAVAVDGSAVIRSHSGETDVPYPPSCRDGAEVGGELEGSEQPGSLAARIVALASRFAGAGRRGRSEPGIDNLPVNYFGIVGGGQALALAPAFGRLAARDMRNLIAWAGRHGSGELRLTTRSVLIPHLDRGAADELMLEARAAGFIVDGADPRAALVACPGRPACASAFQPAQEDALALAEVAAGLFGTVHVSACAKGCARQAPAPLTLVGEARGYGVVLGGSVRDAPLAVRTLPELGALLRRVAVARPAPGEAIAAVRRELEKEMPP